MDYNNYSYNQSQRAVDTQASAAMRLVYLQMTLGLVVTALVSLFCYSSPAYWTFLSSNSWAIWGLFILEFVLVIGISAGINKLSAPTAALLFYVFAAVNGAALAPIFMVYAHASIAKTFFITAGVFGAMSIYGYTTSSDLTKMGSILIMCLFGLIIVSVINIFARSSSLEWIISFAGVAIFIGLTAYDTQKVKQLAAMLPASQVGRVAVLGALNLYLDFINLFLYLLRFFGNSRD